MTGYLSGSAGALAALSTILLAGAGARAQSPCADEYVMQPGDTLYQVTQQCRVGLSALLDANPQIGDIRDIAVGTRLEIPGAAGGADGTPPERRAHRVAPGETLFSLAERYGTSVEALLEANPGLDIDNLEIGLTIHVPGIPPDGDGGPIAGEPTINVQPLAGGPGAPINVSGDNYIPGRTVEIGVGPPQSEWRPLEQVQVQPDGEVEAHVQIPENARPGGQLVFVIHTEAGRTQVSRPVDVVENRDPDAPDGGTDMRTEEGRLEQGTECLVLRSPDGQVFSLIGADSRFGPGDYVRVTGETTDMSFCMQGDATIEVEQVSHTVPPERHDTAPQSGG